MLAVNDLPEGANRVFHFDVLAIGAGELGGHKEGLAQESLDSSGPGHNDLILLGELVHSEDGDNIL